ncbi:hypothetical protein [Pleurocapsa sp. FMAR1]|uniref:hypothetical protein n=1 Tax=Pleurocapsa sp. FMAR1 TaxID=3040204 RepID=UPI0029C62498|nr:hypothetical protein [Pleurocapsa sp. FMAR1]
MPSQEELVNTIIKASELLDSNSSALEKLASYLYIADPRIHNYLNKFNQLLKIESPKSSQLQERGKILEQIVYLVFNSFKGITSFKSFQSASSQYDLIVSGDDVNWHPVCKHLYMDISQRDIIIEAKAKNSKLPDKDFARLCSIMHENITGAGLGIFFTLKGATGFPDRNSSSRQRKISDCRLRQALFQAKTGKHIIVLDKEDIFELGKNGTLLQILTRKIRDLKELSGLPTVPIERFVEIDLPPHLEELV